MVDWVGDHHRDVLTCYTIKFHHKIASKHEDQKIHENSCEKHINCKGMRLKGEEQPYMKLILGIAQDGIYHKTQI